jgi:hypothetical protein
MPKFIWVVYVFPKGLYSEEEKADLEDALERGIFPGAVKTHSEILEKVKKDATFAIGPLEESYHIKERKDKFAHPEIIENRKLLVFVSEHGNIDGMRETIEEYSKHVLAPDELDYVTARFPYPDDYIDPPIEEEKDNTLGKLFLLLVGLTGAYFVLRG